MTESPSSSNGRGTSLSIAIPTIRRPHALAMTLASLAWQRIDAPGSEVIIVDNDPAQSARAVVESWPAPAGWTVRYVREPKPGKVQALNTALDHVRQALVCLFDDDIVFFPDTLAAYQRAAAAWPQADYFGGPFLPQCADGVPDGFELEGKHRIYLVWPSHDLGAADRLYQPKENPLGGNRMVRRSVFERGVRFESKFLDYKLYWSPADDIYFASTLRALGLQAVYVAGAKAWHMTERQLFEPKRLWRRYEAFGRYQVLAKAVPNRGSVRLLYDILRDGVAVGGHRLAGQRAASRYHRYEIARTLGVMKQRMAKAR